VLVNGAVHVAPHTSDLHIGFLDKPAITNTLTTRPRGVNHERSEALHPSLDGDMVDVDAAFGEKFFDIAVRESVAEVPAQRQQDHARWEPESRKRRKSRAATTTTTTNHPGTLRPHPIVNATVPLAVDVPERREPSGVYSRCMSSTRTQVYLTDEQREKIDRVAAVEGLSMAQVIRHAVDEYLDDRPDPDAALAATFGAAPDAGIPSRDAWSRG
jgi:hypothetical protein